MPRPNVVAPAHFEPTQAFALGSNTWLEDVPEDADMPVGELDWALVENGAGDIVNWGLDDSEPGAPPLFFFVSYAKY